MGSSGPAKNPSGKKLCQWTLGVSRVRRNLQRARARLCIGDRASAMGRARLVRAESLNNRVRLTTCRIVLNRNLSAAPVISRVRASFDMAGVA